MINDDEQSGYVKLWIDRINDKYPYLVEKTFNDNTSVTLRFDWNDFDPRQAERLLDNTHQSLLVAGKINNGENPYGGKLILRISKENRGLALGNSTNFISELMSLDDDSQMAAVLHEHMESLQEEVYTRKNGYNLPSTETVPLTTEYLFCGSDRAPLFNRLTGKVFHSNNYGDSHVVGWMHSLKFLLGRDGDFELGLHSPEEVTEKISAFKKKNEDEKVAIIQELISGFKN